MIILHSYLNFKFRWHHKLVSFNRIKYCRLVRVLLPLVHLLLHLHLLLLCHLRVHPHHFLHLRLLLLLHLLLNHLLLTIHVLCCSLVFLLLHLLCVHFWRHVNGCFHLLLISWRNLFFLLWGCLTTVGGSRTGVCIGSIVLWRCLIFLGVSHI